MPTSTNRPWRRIATRSHTASTSDRMCDERKTVWPFARAAWTHDRNSTSIRGSRPLVGSSSTSRSASTMKAAMRAIFWRLPFE